MRVLHTLATTLLCVSSFATAASPAQTKAALQDLAAFSKAFVNGPYKSIIKEVVAAVPASVLASVIKQATPGAANPVLANDGLSLVGLTQFATAPIAALSSVSTPALFKALPPSVRSDILALETHIDLKQASIIRSDLGITAAVSTPTAMSSAAASSSASASKASSSAAASSSASASMASSSAASSISGGPSQTATSKNAKPSKSVSKNGAAPSTLGVKLAGAAVGMFGVGIALL